MSPIDITKLVGAFLLVSLVFGGGYKTASVIGEARYQRASAQYAENMRKVSDEAARALAEQVRTREALTQELAERDQAHTKEMTNANDEIERARVALDIAPATIGVLSCPGADTGGGNVVPRATTASRMDNGTSPRRAIVDPKAAARVLAIVAEGDRARVKLAACQDYARAVSQKGK